VAEQLGTDLYLVDDGFMIERRRLFDDRDFIADYVPGSARVLICAGAGHARIVRSYVLPNVSAAILVLATTQLGAAVLAESTLSFLGYGVPPPFPTWGAMLSGTGRAFMLQSPWLSIWPGLAISAAVFGFNMLGDALRDIFDPRLRGR